MSAGVVLSAGECEVNLQAPLSKGDRQGSSSIYSAGPLYLVQINKHVIIGLDHKVCLRTELRHPEVAHDALVGEVVVAVDEVSLHEVTVTAALILKGSLDRFIQNGS